MDLFEKNKEKAAQLLSIRSELEEQRKGIGHWKRSGYALLFIVFLLGIGLARLWGIYFVFVGLLAFVGIGVIVIQSQVGRLEYRYSSGIQGQLLPLLLGCLPDYELDYQADCEKTFGHCRLSGFFYKIRKCRIDYHLTTRFADCSVMMSKTSLKFAKWRFFDGMFVCIKLGHLPKSCIVVPQDEELRKANRKASKSIEIHYTAEDLRNDNTSKLPAELANAFRLAFRQWGWKGTYLSIVGRYCYVAVRQKKMFFLPDLSTRLDSASLQNLALPIDEFLVESEKFTKALKKAFESIAA